jgi:hypothetical protein
LIPGMRGGKLSRYKMFDDVSVTGPTATARSARL